MKSCCNTGKVMGYAGLLGCCNFGSDEIRISQCYNTGLVYSNSYYAAGIAGGCSIDVIIENCYNQGDVEASQVDNRTCQVSGIYGVFEGYCKTTIKHCYNTGKIISPHNSAPISYSDYKENLDISDSYYLEDCVENFTNQQGESKTLEDFVSGKVCVLLNGDQSPTPWGQEIGVDSYPVLNGKGNPISGIQDATIELKTGKGDVFYDLTGRKVDKRNIKNGIYISNGKKLVVR